MNIQSNMKLLVGATLIALTVGCASVPPRELVQRNDHAGLVGWYQAEAVNLRGRAEEMRKMAKDYERRMTKPKQRTVLVQHCRNLVEIYTKAADEADALAKLHEKQQGN